MTQTDIFAFLHPPYRITKPIRLIELFAGVGTQAMALRDLGANFTRWKTCEWDYHAILSYAAIHCGDDKTDYSRNLCDSVLTNSLHQWGISADGKKPMELASIKSLPNSKKREIYNAITATHNMVNILSVTADDLSITDTDRYEYIMTYSFPCQDLSLAGKGKGMEKGSGTRSSLLWEVERILLESKERNELPQVLLMENVPEVIGAKNYQHFTTWYTSLERMGYQSYYKLLNAKDYGVPQSRDRCFMVSILGDYSYTFPKTVPLEKWLCDVLEQEVDERYYINDEIARKFANKGDISKTIRVSGRLSLDRSHTWDVIQIGNCIPTENRNNPNQGRIYATEGLAPTIMTMQSGNSQPMIIQNGHGFNKGGMKEICPTITTGAFRENNFVAEPVICASRGRNLDNPKSRQSRLPTEQMIEINTSGCSNTLTTVQKDNMVLSNQRIRRLTPLECWRLMDYTDDDFRKAKAVNSDTQLYKQAGNGIVKAVLMAIFRQLLE